MTPLRTAAGAFASILVLGCRGEPEPVQPSPPVALAFAEPERPWQLPLPGFDPEEGSQPTLHARVVGYRGALTSEPIELTSPGTLEFVPIVFGRPRPGCRVDVEWVHEHGSEAVWAGAPVFVSRQAGLAPLDGVARPTRVAVAPQDGRPRLRFTQRGACSDAPGALARAAIWPGHEPRPPILLICSDTHRYDHALGDAAGLMPRLQAFSEDAVVYEHAYSTASWTLPSITTTLTGLYPRFHRTGHRIESGPLDAWDPQRRMPPGQFPISWGDQVHVFTAYPDSLANLGTRLHRYGYETAAVVANTLYVTSGLLSAGFDLVIDANGRQGDEVNRLVQHVVERQDRERPLFLLVHYMDVHEYVRWGHRPGERSGERSTLRADDVRRRYARQVRAADEFIGRLLASWDAAFGPGESLVAIYSDHGEHLREPHRPTETHGDSMDEVLLHVPLVVRYPERLGVSPGRERRNVSLVDVVPTLLDAVGAETDLDALQGASLLRLARDVEPSRPLFADYQLAGDELSSVRRGAFKLILNRSQGGRTLLDVASPARALEPKIEDPEQESGLAALFEEYRARAEVATADLESRRVMDEDLRERLRAIGYAQ